nr:proline-rich receptor-like protein kinase PERK14 [Lolium perenne]
MEEESQEEEGVGMEFWRKLAEQEALRKAELYQPGGGDKLRQGSHCQVLPPLSLSSLLSNPSPTRPRAPLAPSSSPRPLHDVVVPAAARRCSGLPCSAAPPLPGLRSPSPRRHLDHRSSLPRASPRWPPPPPYTFCRTAPSDTSALEPRCPPLTPTLPCYRCCSSPLAAKTCVRPDLVDLQGCAIPNPASLCCTRAHGQDRLPPPSSRASSVPLAKASATPASSLRLVPASGPAAPDRVFSVPAWSVPVTSPLALPC